MHDWYESLESDLPMWVLDLDDARYSTGHRRLCVWQDEFDALWHWEIQTWHGNGVAQEGKAAGRDDAMRAAVAAARAAAGNAGWQS